MAKQSLKKSKSIASTDLTVSFSRVPAWLEGFPSPSQNILLTILTVLSFLIYANTIANEYALDDVFVVTGNEYTKQGFAGIDELFRYDTMRGFWGVEGSRTKLIYYRPLSVVTLAIEYGILGEGNPHVSHFFNVLFFAATVGVLFLLLLKLGFAQTHAFFICLLFAVHPIHTEVVANIKARDEIFSLLFLLISSYFLFQFVDVQKRIYLGASWVFYVLALLSKENGVTFLGILPLALFYFSKLPLKKIALYILPFIVIFIAYLLFRKAFIGLNFKVTAVSVLDNFYTNVPKATKYATIFYVLGFYWMHLIWPYPLTWDYSYRQIPYYTFADWQPWLFLLFHLAILIWAVRNAFQKNIIAFGILFYLASLSIVSNLFIDIGGYIAERFLYQPSLGFIIAAYFGIIFLYTSILNFKAENYKTAKILFIAPIIGIVLLSSYLVIARNAEWKNNDILFLADIEKSPNSAKTNQSVGKVYMDQAVALKDTKNHARMKELAQKALPYLLKAISIHSLYFEPNVELGNAYLILGDTAKAIAHWTRAYELNSTHHTIKDKAAQLAAYYYSLAEVALPKGDFKYIKSMLEKSLYFDPNNAVAWSNMSFCNLQLNLVKEAILTAQKSVALDPKNPEFRFKLAIAYLRDNNKEAARAELQQALALNPNFTPAKQALEEL
ncbi:MAG: tetratricopeptide repeat protein [Bacteroidia bacterium]|nr:tetratricopeptide repeat protein [Bacteroidia bacterium]MDW8159312.1 tetratricopeptide repeat protein [Bacteroidia bacterium]